MVVFERITVNIYFYVNLNLLLFILAQTSLV